MRILFFIWLGCMIGAIISLFSIKFILLPIASWLWDKGED